MLSPVIGESASPMIVFGLLGGAVRPVRSGGMVVAQSGRLLFVASGFPLAAGVASVCPLGGFPPAEEGGVVAPEACP
jgi:hypothetical protein